MATQTPRLKTETRATAHTPPMWLRISVGGTEQGETDMPYVGEVRMFAGAIPAKWLNLSSGPVSRTTFAELFAVIGTVWGPGDGSTTFDLPPSQRVPIAVGATGPLTPRALGDVGGVEEVTLASFQCGIPDAVNIPITDPGHDHGVGSIADTGHTHPVGAGVTIAITDPGHVHQAAAGAFVVDEAGTEYVNAGGDKGGTHSPTGTATADVTAAASGSTDSDNANLTGTVATNTTGISAATSAINAAAAHENMPPFAAYNFAIYANA